MPNPSILTPYPADFKVPSVSTGFFKPTSGNAGGGPIFTGSAASGLGIPRPGATISTNEFGLDVTELAWDVQTAKALGLKPEPRDPHPYIGGMYCTESSSTDGEGLMSVVRATYKGLVKNQVRPAERQLFVNTTTDTVQLQNGSTIVGGGGAGNQIGTATANILTVQVALPSPVFSLRGASTSEPDSTLLGKFFKSPPRAPAVNTLFEWPIITYLVNATATLGYLQYKPIDAGWLMDKQEWNEAALHYEVTQQFRLIYRLAGIRAPNADGS